MILSFKHKGLQLLYEESSTRRIQAEHAEKLQNILARLDVARNPDDMNLPGFRLHELKGARKGTWAVTVRANWRVTFRFEGDNIADVHYEDYH